MTYDLQEACLDRLVTARVENKNSVYKDINVLLSHTARAAGKNWFKVFTGYFPASKMGSQLWFSEEELEMEQGWALMDESDGWDGRDGWDGNEVSV